MSISFRCFSACLLLSLLAVGCNSNQPSGGGASFEDGGTAATSSKSPVTGNKDKDLLTEAGLNKDKKEDDHEHEKEKGTKRSDLAGKWLMMFSQGGMDYQFCLLDVTVKDNKLEATVSEKAALFGAAKLKSVEGGAENIHVMFDAPQNKFEFQGELQEGIVRGTLLVSRVMVAPAAMFAVQEGSVLNDEKNPSPAVDRDEMAKAWSSNERWDALQQFAKNNPHSPTLLDCYQLLIALAKNEKLSEADTQKFVDEYAAAAKEWGPLLETKAYLDAGEALGLAKYHPDMALKLLEKARKQFNADTPESFQVSLASGLVGLEKLDEAIKLLKPLHEQHPTDIAVTYSLARAFEKHNELDQAIDLYADLAVGPLLEGALTQMVHEAKDNPPSELVAVLWKKKHGSTEGLDALLNEKYEKLLKSYVKERKDVPPVEADSRIPLLEMLTGTTCPMCVAADVAVNAISQNFKPAELLIIRYHVHIPRPDPLANTETGDRFEYYKPLGAPAIFLNGAPVDGVGGSLNEAEQSYQALRGKIEAALGKKSEIALELSAQAEEGKLKISADVNGLKEMPPTLRLRLAIIEEGIHYVAPNGIRVHDGVVRHMPGGSGGVEPADNKLTYRGELTFADLKAGLNKYLSRSEEVFGRTFEVRPMDFKTLQLVAFVQNDKTKEILQSKIVPITGTVGPEKPVVEKPAEEKKPEEKTSDEKAEEKKS